MANEANPTSLARARMICICDDLNFLADELTALSGRARDQSEALAIANGIRGLAYAMPRLFPELFGEEPR